MWTEGTETQEEPQARQLVCVSGGVSWPRQQDVYWRRWFSGSCAQRLHSFKAAAAAAREENRARSGDAVPRNRKLKKTKKQKNASLLLHTHAQTSAAFLRQTNRLGIRKQAVTKTACLAISHFKQLALGSKLLLIYKANTKNINLN